MEKALNPPDTFYSFCPPVVINPMNLCWPSRFQAQVQGPRTKPGLLLVLLVHLLVSISDSSMHLLPTYFLVFCATGYDLGFFPGNPFSQVICSIFFRAVLYFSG